MIKDKAVVSDSGVTGKLQIVLTDAAGNLKTERNIHNLVVTDGKEFIASLLQLAGPTGQITTRMTHMAVGQGNATPLANDAGLQNEASLDVPSATRSAITSVTLTGTTVTYVATFGPGVGTGPLQEAAILSASSGGTMLARTTFNVVNKDAGDSLTITWSITIS